MIRKKLTLDEAVDKLSAIIEKHLKHLPPAERRRRIKRAHDRLVERLAEKRKWN